MEQNKNIFQLFSDLIEKKGTSWFLPSKEESLADSVLFILILVMLIPLYGIILFIRVLVLICKLFLSLFVRRKKRADSVKTYAINKSITQATIYCVLIVCTIFFSSRMLHEYAKKRNASIITNYDFYSDAYYRSMPDDYVLGNAFGAIKEAMENEYTNRNVIKLRKQINIDDDFAKGLHFQSPDDFVMYLYSLKEIDEEVRDYINEADSLGVFNRILDYYKIAALNDFEKGNYYNASAEMKHYFKIYRRQSAFPSDGENNDMHLLKLLLQGRWELTTNRSFADKAYKCISSCCYGNDDVFNNFGDLKKLGNGTPFLMDVSTYFEGLSEFRNKKYRSALQLFEKCFDNTNDITLRQYCALMSIRTAFWNYDSLRNDEALVLYREIYAKYAPNVTMDYFIPDLIRYQSVVTEIINNPQYTGY